LLAKARPVLPDSEDSMVRTLVYGFAHVALCLCALAAHAQPARNAQPDPLDPMADAPRVQHESAFKNYRRLGDAKPTPWQGANETVNRIGGWRAYAREASQPEAAPAARPAAPASAPAGPGGGHPQHHGKQ